MPPTRNGRAARQRAEASDELADELQQAAMVLLLEAETEDEELDALIMLALANDAKKRTRRSARYGPRGKYDAPVCTEFFDLLFNAWSDRKFKSWMRMSQTAFDHLLDLIQDDPVFKSKGQKPQTAVRIQLATFLAKYGGDNSLHAATVAGISEGSAYNFCERVITAVRNLRDHFVRWPDAEERDSIKAAMADFGFAGCTGLIDGSLVRLVDKPVRNPYAYWTRKKFYGIALQTVCDHRGRFTEYETGWPGSVADTTLLKESHMWKNKPQYFADDEYLLADKGYPLTKHSIRPFGEHELTNNAAEKRRRKKFNYKLSAIRIEVEHAFGRLKGRFPVLSEFPGRDINQIYRAVEALLVIHNILIDFGDLEADIDDYKYRAADDDDDSDDEGPAPAANLGVAALREAGIQRRDALLDHINA